MNLECKTMDINKKTMKYVNENITKNTGGAVIINSFCNSSKSPSYKVVVWEITIHHYLWHTILASEIQV